MPSSRSKSRRRPATSARPETISLTVSRKELEDLIALSAYYGRVLGTVRRCIEMVSGAEMRGKARFIREESYWLRRFLVDGRERLSDDDDASVALQCTPRSLVALYGRLLASLNLPRTRRKLSPQTIQRREGLAEKMADALRGLQRENAGLVEREIETRRAREQTWIAESLQPRESIE